MYHRHRRITGSAALEIVLYTKVFYLAMRDTLLDGDYLACDRCMGVEEGSCGFRYPIEQSFPPRESGT